jgi:hypothetical protein
VANVIIDTVSEANWEYLVTANDNKQNKLSSYANE